MLRDSLVKDVVQQCNDCGSYVRLRALSFADFVCAVSLMPKHALAVSTSAAIGRTPTPYAWQPALLLDGHFAELTVDIGTTA